MLQHSCIVGTFCETETPEDVLKEADGACCLQLCMYSCMSRSLAGKTCVVTGANAGLGLETAQVLVSSECGVSGVHRAEQRAAVTPAIQQVKTLHHG